MIHYTRVTMVTPRSRAEAVLPSDEAVGTFLPGLLHLLGADTEPTGGPLSLVRWDGDVIDLEQDLETQDVLDGEVIRVVADDDVPPPTEVTDISNALADASESHPGWRTEADRITCYSLVTAVLTAATAWMCVERLSESWSTLVLVLPGLAAVALGAGAHRALGRRAQGFATLLSWSGLGWLLPLAWKCASPGAEPRDARTVLGALLAAGAVYALGRGRPGWAAGGALGLGLEVLWIAAAALAPGNMLARGVFGVTAAALLGALPWMALLLSGLSRLDHDVLAGTRPRRERVQRSLVAAHDSMMVACVLLTVAIAWAASDLACLPSTWARALAGTLAALLLLRSRAFPLRVEVATMWVCAMAPLLLLLSAVPALTTRVLVLGGLVVLLALSALYRPTARVRIRMGQGCDLLESLTMVATVPLLCGLAGVFTYLLGLFS